MQRVSDVLGEMVPALLLMLFALVMLFGGSCSTLAAIHAGGWYQTRAESEPCAKQGGEVYVTVSATGDIRWWCCVESAGMCEALLSSNVIRP